MYRKFLQTNFQIQIYTKLLLAGWCYLPLKNQMVIFFTCYNFKISTFQALQKYPRPSSRACTTMSAPVKHSWVLTSPEGVVMLTWPSSCSLQRGQVVWISIIPTEIPGRAKGIPVFANKNCLTKPSIKWSTRKNEFERLKPWSKKHRTWESFHGP